MLIGFLRAPLTAHRTRALPLPLLSPILFLSFPLFPFSGLRDWGIELYDNRRIALCFFAAANEHFLCSRVESFFRQHLSAAPLLLPIAMPRAFVIPSSRAVYGYVPFPSIAVLIPFPGDLCFDQQEFSSPDALLFPPLEGTQACPSRPSYPAYPSRNDLRVSASVIPESLSEDHLSYNPRLDSCLWIPFRNSVSAFD